MTTQILGKNCDGGHYTCSPPKECCKQGCCYLVTPSIYRPPAVPSGTLLNPLFLGHWYFWIAVTATVAGILCACSIWRRHTQNSLFCCRDNGGRDAERASEPDSNGSCYLPPQYSRCNSFHQAPPPYSEVTSKPDLYPLVISYNGDNGVKNNNSTANSYSMVQYFRNFIVRPVGTLSATSTYDSLSSSFICNASNEANTLIPPPYSCMGSLEEVVANQQQQLTEERALQRSASSISGIEVLPTIHNSGSLHSNLSTATSNRQNAVVSITDNPCFGQQNSTSINVDNNNRNNTGTSTVPSNLELVADSVACKSQSNCDETTYKPKKPNSQHLLQNERSQDSESQDDDHHNFSDLLNLSVCLTNPNQTTTTTTNQRSSSSTTSQHLLQEFSVTNSITDSDISSLANLGTPDSPPRATSPTLEMREILDKIQQLPQQKSPTTSTTTTAMATDSKIGRNYFHRSKAKTLYMPLHSYDADNVNNTKTKLLPRGWLSRSAPTTPCGNNLVPTFPIHYHHLHHHHHHKKIGSNSQRNSKLMLNDGSPLLLKEHEESEEDANNRDECL